VIEFRDGTSFEVRGEELVGFLQRQVFKTLIPIYLERLQRGEKVSLSPFKLTHESLIYEGDEIPWGRIGEVFVVRNFFTVETLSGKTWAEVPLLEVGMASVLLALAKGLVEKYNPSAGQPERNPFDFD
jgi:hypothetical protein